MGDKIHPQNDEGKKGVRICSLVPRPGNEARSVWYCKEDELLRKCTTKNVVMNDKCWVGENRLTSCIALPRDPRL